MFFFHVCFYLLFILWCSGARHSRTLTMFSRISSDLDVPSKRAKGRLKRWLDTIHADLKLAGIHPDQAHDRTKWRPKLTNADHASRREKR
ncbi:hypothetical protein Y032_0306g1995 [Ancylostoma ceylanicum]|uniref:Secreted protein n=1 Tax=Ancylostoma ceylanicum TaxID=53326 RepID=A0A016S443_9BILA|nr:hypothetical protein Y032_0306g1995 [Ancylostoma ceylanicum]